MRTLSLTVFLWCLSLIAPFPEQQIVAQTKRGKKPETPPKIEQPKPELLKPQRKGAAVKSILNESYSYKFGKPVDQGTKLEFVEFDPQGKRTLSVRYDDGRPVERIVSGYDPNGNKVEERKFDDDNTLTAWTSYNYDASGNPVEEMKHSLRDSTITEKLVFRYDENRNRVEEVLYDADGSIENKVSFGYDANRNKIETETYRSDGRLRSKEKCVYDPRGKKLEAIMYDAEGSVESKTTYKYDANGNLLEETTAEKDGSVAAKTEYKYDPAGNKTEFIKYRSAGRLESRERYKHDAKRKVETSFYDSDDAFTHKILFTYDTHSNLAEEIDYDKLGEPQKMIRSVITYFP